MFLESARFYRLLRSNPNFDAIVARLRDAIPEQRLLQINLTSADHEIIADAND